MGSRPVSQMALGGDRPSLLSHLAALALGAFSLALSATPTAAAERIVFTLGPLSRSIQVQTLADFAATGTVNRELELYFDFADVNETQQAAFRNALRESVDIDPTLLSRFFYSRIGEAILSEFLGDLIRTPSGINGEYALRSAIVLAAQEPEGLSVLNFLQELPTDVRVDVLAVLELSNAVGTIVEGTQFAVDTLDTLASAEAENDEAIAYSALPDLTQPGPFAVETQRWQLEDQTRSFPPGEPSRSLYVDVYQPQTWPRGKTSVVIFSHGLASNPESFRDQAKHLASYGFFIAAPQHPGSDLEQAERFRRGLSNQIFYLNEFIDRPLDIRYMIDELERRNEAEYDGRLDLNRVGVWGHSFGGYTALAIAGAEIQFDHLRAVCSNQFNYLNISLLLQCQALRLPRQDYDVRDERVTAVMVNNPVNSSVFGPSGLDQIQIPVSIMAGSYDPATPAVFEQFNTFPWFTTPNKYLGLIEGQAHVDFSELDAGITETINSVEWLTLPNPALVDNYSNAFGLAFFNVYIAQAEEFRPFLQSSYAAFLSQNRRFKLYLISSESEDELDDALETFWMNHKLE